MLFALFIVICIIVWAVFFRSPANCSDGIKNGNEIGLDCGGSCKNVCKEEVVPLTTLWSKFFPLRDGAVNVAALVENQNANFAIPRLEYNFKIYDKDNILITERAGVTFANTKERFLVLESNIQVGERIPARAFVEFRESRWERYTKAFGPLPLVLKQESLIGGDTPSLKARIDNNGLKTLYDLTILSLVVDKNENALGVSSTFINSLSAGKSQSIQFAWPHAFVGEPIAASLYPRINRTLEVVK